MKGILRSDMFPFLSEVNHVDKRIANVKFQRDFFLCKNFIFSQLSYFFYLIFCKFGVTVVHSSICSIYHSVMFILKRCYPFKIIGTVICSFVIFVINFITVRFRPNKCFSN